MKKLFGIFCFLAIMIKCTKVVDGFQDKISYNPEENIDVFLNANSNKELSINLLDINRNSIDELNVTVFEQPKVDNNSWYELGFDYKKTFSYNPKELKSGIYWFKNSSPFVIKNPTKKNDVLVVYPSNTANAYNDKGGRSTYTTPIGISLSLRRPVNLQEETKEFLEWLPSQGFGVDYICDSDLDDYSNIENYKVLIIPGHNEYWTRIGRNNFDKFINSGGNAVVLSGNTMWKQVRYEKNNVICFNDYYSDSLVVDSLRTSNYSLVYLKYPTEQSIGVNFINAGYGLDEANGWDGYKIVAKSPLLEGTGIEVGDIISIPTKEFDGAPLLFLNDKPYLDTSKQNFFKQKLIGYDKAYRGKEGFGTFVVFQKTETSGVIINKASTNWCSSGFKLRDRDKIKKLTYNFIDFLLKDKSVFN